MARLGHKKSRLGCRQCKARHVKCDELKPCTNCARHGVQCSLITWEPTPSAPNPSAASSSAPKRERRAPDTKERPDTSSPHTDQNVSTSSPKNVASEVSSPSSQSDRFPFLSQFIHKSENSQTDLWIRDIELIHHWTVEALSVLSHREDIHHMWRVEAPKHAVVHTFLMHQMLAFSAFHKTYQNPDRAQEYYTLGIHHQDHAIKGLRQKLQNITPHESPAIFAASILLTIVVFASTGFEATMPMAPDAIEGIMNLFSLMQGMGSTLALAHVHVLGSFVAPVVGDPTEVTPSQPMLQELARHLPSLVSFIGSKSDIDDKRRAEYLRTIASMENTIKLADPPLVDNRELRFLFIWPLHLEPSFLDDIRQRRPGALVILMYYATLLYAAQPLYWFMDGWGNRLMKACYAGIDESWMPVLNWPISFLNLDPTFDPYTYQGHLPHNPEGDSGPPSTQQLPDIGTRYAPIHSIPSRWTVPKVSPQPQQHETNTNTGTLHQQDPVGPPT